MPTRDTPWPAGRPCWADLATSDVEDAKNFYGKVLGWSFTDTGDDFGNYQMCTTNGKTAAGIGSVQGEGQPTTWTVYLASEDADGTAKAITEHGGTVLAEPFDVPSAGRMLIAADTQGAAFGVWQATGSVGAEIYGEPGSLAWTDARHPDPEDGRRFYAAVFGHTHQPVPGAPDDYTTIHLDDGAPVGGIGGMMGAPHGTPPHWIAYFSVADTDAAAEAAKENGGTVDGKPSDNAFGRMATILDPQGARFMVVGPTSG
jgi:predicted enzyme related to lactoylglutathione lyase